MHEELERWVRIKAQCEESIDRLGAIMEATTDRGQAVLRKNPSVDLLLKAEKKIEQLQKELTSGLDLD